MILGCKIIDWQLLAGAPPMADIVSMLFYSGNPDILEEGLHEILENYYKKFHETCDSCNLKVPFTFEDLKKDVENKGFALVFCVTLFFYDPVCREPNIMKRFRWVLEKSLHYSPGLFQ